MFRPHFLPLTFARICKPCNYKCTHTTGNHKLYAMSKLNVGDKPLTARMKIGKIVTVTADVVAAAFAGDEGKPDQQQPQRFSTLPHT